MKRLYRSSKNRILGGVLGGIGEYFQIDPTLIRLLFILILFFGAFFVPAIVYFIAVIIIPQDPEVF